jgi:hypothetical protein
VVASHSWCPKKPGFLQLFDLLEREVIGQKYSFNCTFVHLNQFKTFVHATNFWLTYDDGVWREIVQLYWRCFGLEVIDIISRWFESNPLLQSLQLKSLDLGSGLYTSRLGMAREDMLTLLYGHLGLEFWSHAIEMARIAQKNTPNKESKGTEPEVVNLRNVRTLGQRIDISKGDILSHIYHAIHSKFWINSRHFQEKVAPPDPKEQTNGTTDGPHQYKWYPTLISTSLRGSVLPCLPLLFDELSDECRGLIRKPEEVSGRGKNKVFGWLEYDEGRHDGEKNDSQRHEHWDSPELEEEKGSGHLYREEVGENDKGVLCETPEGGSEFSEKGQSEVMFGGQDGRGGKKQKSGKWGEFRRGKNREISRNAGNYGNSGDAGDAGDDERPKEDIELSGRYHRVRAHTM